MYVHKLYDKWIFLCLDAIEHLSFRRHIPYDSSRNAVFKLPNQLKPPLRALLFHLRLCWCSTRTTRS